MEVGAGVAMGGVASVLIDDGEDELDIWDEDEVDGEHEDGTSGAGYIPSAGRECSPVYSDKHPLSGELPLNDKDKDDQNDHKENKMTPFPINQQVGAAGNVGPSHVKTGSDHGGLQAAGVLDSELPDFS